MRNLIYLTLLLFIVSSCQKDKNEERDFLLDNELEKALTNASNGVGKTHFVLPGSNDFNSIPQDPKNPLSVKKIELGKLLYHETGLALSPKKESSKSQFACASCHFASAGFQACRVQGIAEGGMGFGLNGEGRIKNTEYDDADLDVQPIRTPSAMNTAYQKLMLWNGQFGATDMNTGTEDKWESGTPIETNFLGYEGLETQAIAGLKVHRMENIKDFIINSTYKNQFDEVFSEVAEDKRYDLERAGLAIAAYERTLLANEAPFQKWLKGEEEALTDDEKERSYFILW